MRREIEALYDALFAYRRAVKDQRKWLDTDPYDPEGLAEADHNEIVKMCGGKLEAAFDAAVASRPKETSGE